MEQWAADIVAPGEQLGVRCLAQGSHLCRGHFLPEPRFEPTTSGYKSNALSIRPRLPPLLLLFSGKTDQAAETVRPRELKLGQIVVVLLATPIQRLVPIGQKGHYSAKKLNFQTFYL